MQESPHLQPDTSDTSFEQKKEDRLREFKDFIAHAPAVSPVDRSKAPFKDYSQNTKKSWQYVTPEEVDQYLGEKFFFDTNDIPYEEKVSLGEIDISAGEECIQIPLDLVVHAAGFKDWRGRGENVGKVWVSEFGISEGSKSVDAIKHYAGLSTDIPRVTRVNMYRQPDGKVYFSNGGGDSHRIAAAILRGCECIETTRVGLYDVKENYI
ncbi:MAG: hypothetical protein RL094_589 [Candidatus Parcubacteria bacterium]|jgi:hypothetical protein